MMDYDEQLDELNELDRQAKRELDIANDNHDAALRDRAENPCMATIKRLRETHAMLKRALAKKEEIAEEFENVWQQKLIFEC